jgi:hypothetical protein
MWLIHQFDSFVNLGICKEQSSMAKAKTPRTTTSRSKQVIQMPEPGTAAATATATASEPRKIAAPVSIDLQGEIRRRAYELYEERGRVHGFEQQDWAQAEREIMARHNHSQSA